MRRPFLVAAVAGTALVAAGAASGADIFNVQRAAEALGQKLVEAVNVFRDTAHDSVPGALYTHYLRMVYEGTPEERAKAQAIILKLFGIDVSHQYSAQVRLEYGGKEPLEVDVFTAASNTAFELNSRVVQNGLTMTNYGQNSPLPLTDAQRKAIIQKKVSDIVLDLPGPCPPAGAPFPCLRELGAQKSAANLVDALTNYFGQEVRPSTAQTITRNWTVTEPFVFVVLRKDQLDKIRASGDRLVVAVSVRQTDKPDETFDHRGEVSIPIERFSHFSPAKDPDRSVEYVAAVQNMGKPISISKEQFEAVRSGSSQKMAAK